MKFHLYTMVYGQKHVELFKQTAFKSLTWPKNYQAIKGKIWNIYTKKEHFEELIALFKDLDFHLQFFEMPDVVRVSGCGFVKTQQCDQGLILLQGFRDQISWSLNAASKLLLVPPDTIFGEGSIENMLKLGEREGTVVTVAHPRVLPEILASLNAPRTNAALVSLTMRHGHEAWQFAEIGHEFNNSYVGGIAWQRLSGGIISVTHRLPTAYLIDFVIQDYDFFWAQVSFGALDHTWPGERLIRQERMRYVGSSEACFVAEVTDKGNNVPPRVPGAQAESDIYWGDKLHHSVNRLFNVIFKEEENGDSAKPTP